MRNTDKMFYEKKVVYLDYLERGEKIKNGGHLKWETKGDISRIEIHIRGLYPTDTLQGEIRLCSFEETLLADRMTLRFGAGEYVAQWNNQNLAETNITLEECDGVEIRISESRMLRGRWRERKKPEEVIDAEKTMDAEEITAAEEAAIPEEVIVPEEVIEPEEFIESEAVIEPKEVEKSEEVTGSAAPKREPVLASDKWEQLSCYYPKLHPFGDNREYLSITPRDFVVLAGKYHNLVHNSFLLHGYYNYGHVVLTKLTEGREEVFYLGVPGVYFEREKQAALMFGFEGFEADSDKITDGGFGYYMKKVEI